jgi:hypothetical protein
MTERHADAPLAVHSRQVMTRQQTPITAPRTGFHDGDVHWLDQAIDLRAFADEHGRLPGSGAGSTAHERRLARWVKSQREADHAERLLARRAAWLDEWVPAWRRPRAQTWQTTAVAVGLHVARFGEYPSASSTDAETRRLGTWLRTQRRAHRAGRLEESRTTWLELNLPYWASPDAETWFGTAELVAEFVAERGHMPRADAEADEARLARWVRSQRAADRADRLDDEQREWLDASLPAWRSVRTANWQRTADDVARFHATWGVLPMPAGTRHREARLGAWLSAQRAAVTAATLADDRIDWLDDRLPGWREARADRWLERLAEAAGFLAATGRLPARTAEADDTERRIAGWVCAQRRAERTGGLTADRRMRLDAHLPGWASTGESVWRTRAQQLAAFAAEHGRLPAVREEDPEARGLAVWLGRQRSLAADGRLADGRERWLRLHIPGWQDHNLGTWLATAERTVAFRAQHSRLPSRATDAGALERELGVWLNNQRNAGRDGRLTPERERWLAEQLPDWQDSRLDAWLARAAEVEQYADEQGRLPHPRSTSPRSKRLGGWLEAQRSAARAGRLKDNRLEWLDTHLPGWNDLAQRPARSTIGAEPRTAGQAPLPAGAAKRPVVSPAGVSPAGDERAARVLREWTERLRARELPLRADQRDWLDRKLPGWDQQTA